MQRFQKDFSAIILDEIALEGLDGITVEALCKRLSNNVYWPLKPVNESVKKIVWSFVVCLKSIDFFRLEKPRSPLVIFNRYDYINSGFGTLYEPENVPQDIYPNHPIEDGTIMGSCEEYYTRFNLGQFPRKISIEEAEKRWDRRLVIVANQDVRTKALIPEDKQCTLKLSLRYFLVLERIGRARYLGEASYGVHSLRVINSDSKVISYIRNRLTEDCLIKNQVIAYAGNSIQTANRILISSLPRFFVQRQSMLDVMVSKIVDYLKSQPNHLAPYDQVKIDCKINSAKIFKQPQLRKLCDTNLKLKYRKIYPNATENEYLYKKNPRNEKIIRCVKLKINENEENPETELEKKSNIDGHEFKKDCTFERQVLRWIEKHSVTGVTLSEISRAFRFTTDGSMEIVLKKLTRLKCISRHYCDRGRAKVFVYFANYYKVINKYDNKEIESVPIFKSQFAEVNNVKEEKNLSVVHNDSLTPTDVEEMENMLLETNEVKEEIQLKEDNDNCNTSNENVNTSLKSESDIECISSQILLDIQNEDTNEYDAMEQDIVRTLETNYCKSLFETSKQTVSLTDRFYFRQQIILNMVSSDNVVSLVNMKKAIIELEKEMPKFIGTLDIKTLIKIVGYLEKSGNLKSVQYRVSVGSKTIHHTFVGTPNIDFTLNNLDLTLCENIKSLLLKLHLLIEQTEPTNNKFKFYFKSGTNAEVVSFMNSFLNRFNNALKTNKAQNKWNLAVFKSPEPKINISELKLPRFMKMRTLHEYLFYIVYDHPGESLTNACKETEATVETYRHDLIQGESKQLPKLYHPSISWKMFVPPLPKYPRYPDGWFFVSDIIHHMPLDLMLKIVNLNKSKVNLDNLVNYATHPVFKYLPLMTLSSEVCSMLSQGLKKHIRNTLNVLRLLCTIGLTQFGPKTYKDTELIFAYLNRRASLLNTVKSSPGYYRVSDIDYEQRKYEFNSDFDLETYWLDTWYFCTNTPLGYKIMNSFTKPKRREIMDRSKVAIESACVSRDVSEVLIEDDGTIPGDNRGAAGFDSHLFSHLSRNWNLKKKTALPPPKKMTKLNILLMQRIKKHTISKKNDKKKIELNRDQLYKIRYKWTSAEDQVLLFWKIGTMIIKKVKSHAFLSYGIKDVIRSIFGKYYRTKSIDNYLRRIRYLMRNNSIAAKVNNLQNDLMNDEEVQNIFKEDIQKQKELYNSKKFKAMRDLIVSNIKQLILFLRERGTVIEIKDILDNKRKSQIEKSLIDIREELDTTDSLPTDGFDMETNSQLISNQQFFVQEIDYIFTVTEITISIVTSLIHSSLNNQSSDPRISLSYFQAFKQYPDDILKQSFNAIKDNNLIICSQYHKESLQILLSTSHIIQSKTYEYGPKYFSILVGNTNINRYKDGYNEYASIKENLFEQKTLLLYPTYSLCPALTYLTLANIVDFSIEFDKKYLEYMPDENLDEASNCLKNTLKRMRSRHFDLLTTCSDSMEYIKIITSVTKQLKNYQVICKLKQSTLPKLEEEIDLMSKNLFKQPTFKPQLELIGSLSELCIQLLEFCQTKGQCGASQRDIKEKYNDLPLTVLAKSLQLLSDKHLVLRTGIEIPVYVHHTYTDVWLIKIPTANWSENDAQTTENKNERLSSEDTSDMVGPPFKKMREEHPQENHNSITYDHIIIRPWTNLNLTINRETLEKFLNSVLSKIIFKPGILLKTLKKDYYPAVQSMYIRELVEMLEEMKCIKMIHLKNVYRPSFLSEPSPKNHNLVFSNVKGLEDESLIMLEPTLDCEIRFGYYSSKYGCNNVN